MHQTEPPSPCVRPISSHGAPLSSSYLPAYSHAAVFVLLVMVAPMLLATVLVHELGHVWAARWLGGECEEVGR